MCVCLGGGGSGDLDPSPKNHKCYRFLAVKKTFQTGSFCSGIFKHEIKTLAHSGHCRDIP